LSSSTANPLPVFVITGQSGAGKGTLIKRLLGLFPQLELAVSATTRPRRPGEEDGVHYYFITDEEFDRRLAEGDFLEYHAFPWGQRSGTLLSEIDRIGDEGKICVLELETEGALNVADKVTGAITIFVTAPIEELERRLKERDTESAGEIGERVRVARQQLAVAGRFDHIVENNDLEHAVGDLSALVRRYAVPAATMPKR
jgi:guanylate kinase